MTNEELLQQAAIAAVEGGIEILKIYQTDFSVETKADHSPLTMADKAAHEAIKARLSNLNIPLLSEEGKEFTYEERKSWRRLWIVDPLDGTKEFVKRNGEFTVNIALIEDHYPVMGVIYVPVKGILYLAAAEKGAFMLEEPDTDQLLSTIREGISYTKAKKLPVKKSSDVFHIVASRSHMSPETEAFVAEQRAKYGNVELVSMGSSLKICLVAEGKAEMYPRFAPTMEWDTAAGQAIAECAGKSFVDWKTGERMRYNRENLLNNWFLVS